MNDDTDRLTDKEAIIELAHILEAVISYTERTGLSGPAQRELQKLRHRAAHVQMSLISRRDDSAELKP